MEYDALAVVLLVVSSIIRAVVGSSTLFVRPNRRVEQLLGVGDSKDLPKNTLMRRAGLSMNAPHTLDIVRSNSSCSYFKPR